MIVIRHDRRSGVNMTDSRRSEITPPAARDEAHRPGAHFISRVGGLAMLSALGVAVTAYVALRTSWGQRLDLAARDAVSSPAPVLSRLYEGLSWVSVEMVGLSLLACVVLAVVRGRLDLALAAVVIIGGANVTTQILKRSIFAEVKLSPGANGLPSGHTTVAMSIALAAVLVAPSAWRSVVAIGASVTATLVAVALVLGRYHRPSDVLAAALVCLGWAALGLLAADQVRRRRPETGHVGHPGPTASIRLGALAGALVVCGLLVALGVRPEPGRHDLWLGILSLGSIGLACATSIAAVAQLTERHLG
jgi:membrane-associated phospholipid phosphatase